MHVEKGSNNQQKRSANISREAPEGGVKSAKCNRGVPIQAEEH